MPDLRRDGGIVIAAQMQRGLLAAATASILSGLVCGWFGCSRFIRVDRCLDHGCVFDYTSSDCLCGAGAPERLPVPEHAIAMELGSMAAGALLILSGVGLARLVRRRASEQ